MWKSFKDSWNELKLDNCMNDGGKYRYRRYLTLEYDSSFNKIVEKPGEPHHQYKKFNDLNGGIKRYFDPVEEKIKNNLIFVSILDVCINLFKRTSLDRSWHIEVHQFRIIAKEDSQGLPTPEGIHRDGVTYAFIMLIERENVVGGESYIYDNHRNPLISYTLENPLDCSFLDDAHLLHSVSPVRPLANHKNAYRDTLVITFTEMASKQKT